MNPSYIQRALLDLCLFLLLLIIHLFYQNILSSFMCVIFYSFSFFFVCIKLNSTISSKGLSYSIPETIKFWCMSENSCLKESFIEYTTDVSNEERACSLSKIVWMLDIVLSSFISLTNVHIVCEPTLPEWYSETQFQESEIWPYCRILVKNSSFVKNPVSHQRS